MDSYPVNVCLNGTCQKAEAQPPEGPGPAPTLLLPSLVTSLSQSSWAAHMHAGTWLAVATSKPGAVLGCLTV